MMPRDTNAHGTIFGGVILSYIDQAGAIEARRQGLQLMVTVSMDKVVFHEPVFVGDLVSFWTETAAHRQHLDHDESRGRGHPRRRPVASASP